MFSCKYCKIFQNSFFHRTSPVAASVERDAEKLKYCSCTFEEKKIKRVLYTNVSRDDSLKMRSVNFSYSLCTIHWETPVLDSPFNKVAGLLQHRCFPVNISKSLRAAFFIDHIWWLLPLKGMLKAKMAQLFV